MRKSFPPNAAQQVKPRFHASVTTDGALELLIYGDIVDASTIALYEYYGVPTDGLISSVNVKKALDSSGAYSKVRLRINSPGGDAFEGMAIHSLLQACNKPVEAFIDGLAASSASIVAMAAGTRVMGRTAMMMIHNAWSICIGNKADMEKMADTLDTIDESIASAYVERTKLTLDQVKALMDAESWFSAQDCLDNGLATAIVAPPAEEEAAANAMARTFRVLAKLKHVPENFKAKACACDCSNCVSGDCSECTNEDCKDENCKDCPMQAGASAQTAAKVRAASGCKCDCANCADGKCSACSKKDCKDDDCMDCPMQKEASTQARSEMEFARARSKARRRRS